ncbi:MAG TPA: efflux RND transporter periplasmic adaptor subunit [Thermoanaerobaculia bacterium]|nr:efflux RND transporter periplasmic adaptor subunit [Thermoanaerobaculia bacterium]
MTSPPAGDLASLRIDRNLKNDDYQTANWKRLLLWAVALVVVAAIAFGGYRKVIVPRRAPAVETMTVRASIMSVNAPTLAATGYLVAERQSSISPKVSGKIIKLNFDTGSKVRAGDVLAVLDSDQTRAQVAEARAAYDEAAREYGRQRSLWRAGIVAKSLFDSAGSQMQVARARLDQATLVLKDAAITAPFDGTITSKNVEIGEVISPLSMGSVPGSTTGGGSIGMLTDLRTLELEADINESNLGQLREGQPAEVTVDAFPGQKWKGRLRQIVPTADRAKGVVKVKITIENPSARLLPEMSAGVSFLQQERTNAELQERPKLWIPTTAVIASESGSRVAVVDGESRVDLREVTLGATRENRVEVMSGLRDGDKIVTSNVSGLEDGQPVKLAQS